MAVLTLFVVGPNAIMSLIGHIRGPRPVQAPDPDVIKNLDVDVVIPVHNERETIALCLAAVMRQTLKPNSITVIDDGSDDDTADLAEAFAAANNLAVRVIRRRHPIGKTPGLKIESRNLEGDVEFILDGDTILWSEDYIEQVVAQLYRVPGIGSACGIVYPLRNADKAKMLDLDQVRRFREQRPDVDLMPKRPLFNRVMHAISNFHRDAVFQFLQKFSYAGLQNLFGSIPTPVGCAVAYRRIYLKEFFDQYEPVMGDNMTSSEDIFIGTAFAAHGYHNTQVLTAVALSDVPEVHRVPRQLVKWSEAWLQTAYYLPDMFISPFRALKRYRHNKRNTAVAQKRRVVDGYRQPFGLQFVKSLGRPAGWIIFGGLVEKIVFPAVLLVFIVLALWEDLLVTILAESALFSGILAYIEKGRRLEYLAKAITATPFRYGMLVFELFVFARFLSDLATARRGWRK